MKAITTKYHGPTDFSGSRISCEAEGYSRVYYPYQYEDRCAHESSMIEYCKKQGWNGTFVLGVSKCNPKGYIYTPVREFNSIEVKA